MNSCTMFFRILLCTGTENNENKTKTEEEGKRYREMNSCTMFFRILLCTGTEKNENKTKTEEEGKRYSGKKNPTA